MKKWAAIMLAAIALGAVGADAEARGHGFSAGRSHSGAGRGTGTHGGHHHHHRAAGFVIFGGPLFWGYPAYSYPYPYGAMPEYVGPTVYIEQATAEDIQQRPTDEYYCADLGFYPQVQACPGGWVRVFRGTAEAMERSGSVGAPVGQ